MKNQNTVLFHAEHIFYASKHRAAQLVRSPRTSTGCTARATVPTWSTCGTPSWQGWVPGHSSTAPTSSKKVNKRVLQTNSYPNKKPKSIDNLSININSSSGVDKPIRTPLKKFPKKTVPFMSKEYQQLKDTCQELLTSIIFR